jgi:hypothetical protein
MRADQAREGDEMEREEEIRLIAYSLWVRDGYPHGRAIEHWLKAEAIRDADHQVKASPVLTVEDAEEDEESGEPSYALSL